MRTSIAEKVANLKEKYEFYPKEFFRRFMGTTCGGTMATLKDPKTGQFVGIKT